MPGAQSRASAAPRTASGSGASGDPPCALRSRPTASGDRRAGGEVVARFGGEGDDGPVVQRLRGAADDGARVGGALPVEHFGHERSAFALKKDGRETNVVRSESRFDKRAA